MNTASFLRATAQSIHQRWIDGQRELRDVSEPTARQMRLDCIRDVYQEAQATITDYGDVLHPLDKQRLENILKRPLSQYITLSKSDNIVPLF
jgi:DNA-binding cell septation regulator SpoVG